MLNRLITGQNLSEKESEQLMNDIMSGKCTENQISGLLTALAVKGETVEEITGFARAMKNKSTKVRVKLPKNEILFDCCGTGGTGSGTFNISTLVAIISSSAGIKVAKHGNRGASSKCGSADIWENLGISLMSDTNRVSQAISSIGIGFLFAPYLHKAMKYAIGPRRELGIRTVFNILGPLTNPAGANCQLMGVFNPHLTEPLAKVLKNLGLKKAMIVHGEGNLDEISTLGETKITELKNKQIHTYYVTPEEFGIKRAQLQDIQGGDITKNLEIAQNILHGKPGPMRDIVLFNAAFALKLCEKVDNIPTGLARAAEIIDTGRALQKLHEVKGFGVK
jgi:anthranilate phosphoribosyltransferase